MKKTFVIWETLDGHKYLNGVIECTEEEVKKILSEQNGRRRIGSLFYG